MLNDLTVTLTQNRVQSATMPFVESLNRWITGPFAFTSLAQGGYATAAFTLALPEVDAYRFLSEHIGRRIVVTNPLADNPEGIVWEGLVYTVTVDTGKNAVARSLANVYNRVRVTYSVIDTTTTPPTLGEQRSTADANDTASQDQYGIRTLKFVTGGISDATGTGAAQQLRDTLLNQYKLPAAATAQAIRGGGATPESYAVTLECVGVWETMERRFHVQSVATAANVSTSVLAALAVGQFISTDVSNVATNTYSYTQYSDGAVTAQGYIDALCAIGGANSRRYYCQIRDSGKPYYYEEPTSISYRARKLDTSEAIYDATTGIVVPPWAVLPGRWIRFDDLLPDSVVASSLVADARTMLIGETQFVAPNVVTLVAAGRDPSQLKLARLGLMG